MKPKYTQLTFEQYVHVNHHIRQYIQSLIDKYGMSFATCRIMPHKHKDHISYGYYNYFSEEQANELAAALRTKFNIKAEVKKTNIAYSIVIGMKRL